MRRDWHTPISISERVRYPYPSRPKVVRLCLDFSPVQLDRTSRAAVPFVLSNGDGEAGQSMKPVTLYLTITVSANMTFPMPHGRAEMSPTEARISLRRAGEAMKPIDGSDTWEKAVGRIKWVMDTLSPITEVRAISIWPLLDWANFHSQLHPFAKIAYGLVSAIPKVRCCGKGNTYTMFTTLDARYS